MLLRPGQITADAPGVDFSGLADEQFDVGDPPAGQPSTGWKTTAGHKQPFPIRAVIDLGAETPLATLWIYDANNTGDVVIHAGRPEAWKAVATYDCKRYKAWAAIPLDTVARYLMLEIKSAGAIFNEIALDAYSPRGWEAVQQAQAEAERTAAERQAALKLAREEALKRPLTELAPFGTLSLVDEVVCGAADPGHDMRSSPAGATRVETVLGNPCRVLAPAKDECAHLTFRLGRRKLLRPHAAYVLAVEYPEDAPRSMVVINTGNETSRGFHTGLALGDALHPKYVDNFVESLNVPLSGRWETWTMLFRLHDRFPELGLARGTSRPRSLTPEDGFDVTIAQFSAKNIALSQGAAVGHIRLYEVVDPDKLALQVNFPPEGLPRRRLFWREEMADGVIEGKNATDRGLENPLDWYRHKAELMRFLGMNTYTKDLLEFGACQHWDSSEYGGNKWVYYNADNKDLWRKIVELMGQFGFDILPYYEYSGSKGQEGLGPQRRAKPLTRDDAFTHIPWIESANADITDPDTYADFRKMLDLTVINLQDKARFAGIWLRPRSQLPVGFGPEALKRFAAEANKQVAVTRDQLKADQTLYARYLAWWYTKRRDFLAAMRDYLREKGVQDAVVLFTGCAGEPGRGFGDFQPRFFTDSPDVWQPILAREEHKPPLERKWQFWTPAQVVEQELYLKALLAPGANWGGWEIQHANPADDPQTYQNVEGVLLSHAFNRLFTVNSPKTLELFRAPAGLALVRHHTLNENMMFDAADKEQLGYFVADVERAGAACMQAEAVAVANGDPTLIGYLCGSNFGRGFPQAVRDFNANFLALPALPSRRLEEASSDPTVVVRTIDTDKHGTYVAVVNTAWTQRQRVQIKLPGSGPVTALAAGKTLTRNGGSITLDLRPYQLIALRVAAP
ncbi:MAG: hypothetical protein NTY19_48640 [Planctomycetota bacterium]|nr:hypothetical protein [Planctomycetota bacterium]